MTSGRHAATPLLDGRVGGAPATGEGANWTARGADWRPPHPTPIPFPLLLLLLPLILLSFTPAITLRWTVCGGGDFCWTAKWGGASALAYVVCESGVPFETCTSDIGLNKSRAAALAEGKDNFGSDFESVCGTFICLWGMCMFKPRCPAPLLMSLFMSLRRCHWKVSRCICCRFFFFIWFLFCLDF